MYPACILHVSCMYFDVSYQDTSRYIKIHQDTFVSVTLAMMMASKHSDNPRDMYPACIPHVSRMCRACILITTEDTCIPHVSRMYPACIPHEACIPSYQIHLSPDAFEIHVSHYVSHYVSRMYPVCILITFEIHVSHDVSLMYPACILYVSWNHCRYMYPACIPHKSLHVSHIYS
jgi:hypothetical protein